MKSFRNVVDGEVRFSISPTSSCPCGSGEPASRCCLTPAGFHRTPTSTAPPLPKTHHSLASCYANLLDDCTSKRSREHYVSRSLLHYLNRNNALRTSGLPWVGDKQVLPPSAFTSRVLCARHNSALSQLDAIAVRLFQAFDEKGTAGSGRQLLHLFSGHDIERWLLKILCGVTSSKAWGVDDDVDFSLPRYWLEILFGEMEFPDEQGLYVCKSLGHRFQGPRGLQLRAIFSGGGQLAGMGLWVCGYELILSMSGFPSRSFDGRKFAYRPSEFYVIAENFEKSIILSWDGASDRGTISLVTGRT